MTDPSDGVQQNLADRIFQTPVIVFRNVTDDRHGVAVRRPIRVLYVVQNFVRRSSTQRNSRQRSTARVSAVKLRVQTNRQFSAFGNRKQFRILDSQFTRARIVRARHIKLVLATVPRCAVNNAAVRREPCVANPAGAKRNLLILGQRSASTCFADPPSQRECNTGQYQNCSRPNQHSAARSNFREATTSRATRHFRGTPRKSRKMLQIKRNVAGRMKSRLWIFLQAMMNDSLQRRRNISIRLRQLRRLFLQNRTHRVGGSLAMKRLLARKHLVENRAKTKYVRPRIKPHP